MADCILGIKCNGVSMDILTLRIDSDQTPYDYICNVSQSGDCNGNGTYDISIIDKNFSKGFNIGGWRITKAWISYDWGNSEAKFVMVDKNGDETYEIIASSEGGSRSSIGYDTDSLARSIFIKARNVVIDYPSANIYNAISKFKNLSSNNQWKYIRDRHKEVGKIDEYLDFLEYATGKINEYLIVYKEVKTLLENSDDSKSPLLLEQLPKDCWKVFKNAEII